MVKEGSYVICVDNSDMDINRYGDLGIAVDSSTYLTIGKVYNVQHIITSSSTGNTIYRVMNDNNTISGYYSSRFISIVESRRLKLERLERL